jgi:hypothetical protein
MRMLGVIALVPVAMMLTVSFFVLFAVKQVEEKGLRAFGWAVAVLLWVVAALVFSAGLFALTSGCGPWGKMMPCGPMGAMRGHEMMMMHGGPCAGMPGGPEAAEKEDAPAAQPAVKAPAKK